MLASGPLTGHLTGKLKTVPTLPGTPYSWIDRLTKERSHSFAFRLDQTRKVAIDLVNTRSPGLLGLTRSRHIEVILWSESGQPEALFSVAPGDRDYETLTLKSGRYLLELKTRTSKKIDYALRLTALKWLMLDCLTG
ncbi:MAG: hypothetical protein ACKO7W_04190 [Elainella sp.]